jgi:uncharacterized lipoprotein YajG
MSYRTMVMKAIGIFVSLLLLVGCGKTPEDPKRPGKNIVPRTMAM